jgi:hypothetical protein
MFSLSAGRFPRRAANLALCAVAGATLAGCPCPPEGLYNERRDEVLPRYFTPEALEVIGDIPMNPGSPNGAIGFAVGDDWGSRLVSAACGYCDQRQVLIYTEAVPERVIFHEYVHQADYSGLISRSLFRERFLMMESDPNPEYQRAAAAVRDLLERLTGENLLADIAYAYDEGIVREGLAYTIELWSQGEIELPDYMFEVYADAVLPEVEPAESAKGSGLWRCGLIGLD